MFHRTAANSCLVCFILVVLFVGMTTWAESQQEPAKPATESPAMQNPQVQGAAGTPAARTRRCVAAGDLNSDGLDELLSWDRASKQLTVMSYASGEPQKLTSTVLQNVPCKMKVADIDGDGKRELVIAEGLAGYNPKEGPQTDVALRIYRPFGPGGWEPQELYRQATERPEFTSLEVVDLDGDKKPEILFSYFSSKYQVDIRAARRQDGAWKIDSLPQIRMGMSVTAGQLQPNGPVEIVVGRPYGDSQPSIGDAFILRGEQRVPLPVHRGVSSVAVGKLQKNKEAVIIVGDGWHMDYGKIARARVAMLSQDKTGWKYELIEDVRDQMRLVQLELVDVDGDGAQEILARGEQSGILGGDVRLYQLTSEGWRGATVANDVQSYAVGRFRGRSLELIPAGYEKLASLNPAQIAWDAELAPEVETFEVDAKSLVDKPAPPIAAAEWIGSTPLTLEQLKGKVVVLDFWATWCGPCISQFPKMREWLEKLGPQGLTIVGMTDFSRQTRGDIDAFLEKQKLPWPVAIDPTKRTSMIYGVGPIPHTVVIDRSGIVRVVHVGAGKLDELEGQIRAIVEKTGS